MRFSRRWIADYTDLPEGDELYELMSMLGFVVDDARPTGNDVTLDLDFPSNRPDAMNHVALAREISVAANQELRLPDDELQPAAGLSSADLAGVRLDDPACPRFMGRVVVDVEVGPSPQWICDRLEAIGLRPINNIVDITNFVMWELGRPMHAYDLDRLDGAELIVRRARAGEHLVTLDEIDRELTDEDLVIADASRVVGLAGVMGGNDTRVTENTTRVLLECAFFDAVTVRRMAKRHGMHTDASHRFERGLSVEGIDQSVRRACGLMQELAGGQVAADAIDVRGEVPARRRLRLRRRRLSGLLGVEPEPEETVRLLEGIGYGVHADDEGFDIIVPARRVDVSREVDLVEDVARLYGYDRIPGTLPVVRSGHDGGPHPALRDEADLRALLDGLGYWEAMTFVFTGASEQAALAGPDAELVQLTNPLSEAFAAMRRSLLPGLLAAVERNHSVGEDRVRLFELGRTFQPAAGGAVDERRTLALVATGAAVADHWQHDPEAFALSDLKGAVETLWRRMSWPALEWRAAAVRGLQEGVSAELRADGHRVGVAGKLDSATAAAFDLETDTWVAELDLEGRVGAPRPPREIRPLARFPASERDVSLLVPDTSSYAAVDEVSGDSADMLLEDIRLLDRYRGEDVESGHSVWTLRLTYRSTERTLTTEEIEAAHDTAVERLVAALAARRR